MKEIFNFAIAFIGMFVMVLCVISAAEVYATENKTSNQANHLWVNSCYSIDENELENPDHSSSEKVKIKTASNTSYITTVKSAGEILRAGMVDRQKTVVIYYKMSSSKLSNSKWFSLLCDDILDYAFLHTGVPDEGDSIKHNVKGYKANADYLKYSDYTYVTITYTLTYYTTAAQENKLTAAVKEFKSDHNTNGKSEYAIVKDIYNYICENVKYDKSDNNLKYTAYNAMVNDSAVCQGYSVLFYRLALEYGIDSRVIAGTGKSQLHTWNIVQIDDKYYNVDSTWDAGINDYDYFLKGSSDFDNHSRSSEYTTNTFKNKYPVNGSNYSCSTHVWSDFYTIDKKATYAATGSKSIHCTVCKCQKADSITAIPKLVCKLPAPETVKTELTSKYGNVSGYDDIKVTWSKVMGASGYYIKYKKTGSKSWNTVATPNLYIFMKDMTDGVKYEIVIIPYIKENGVKYKSNKSKSVISVYTLKKTSITGRIKNPSNKITIKWKGIEGETGYQLFRSTSKNGNYKKIATVRSNDKKTVSVKVSAKKGTVYWYKVRAYKKINNNSFVYSPWSDKVKCVR